MVEYQLWIIFSATQALGSRTEYARICDFQHVLRWKYSVTRLVWGDHAKSLCLLRLPAICKYSLLIVISYLVHASNDSVIAECSGSNTNHICKVRLRTVDLTVQPD